MMIQIELRRLKEEPEIEAWDERLPGWGSREASDTFMQESAAEIIRAA